jgi:hypothetical protein
VADPRAGAHPGAVRPVVILGFYADHDQQDDAVRAPESRDEGACGVKVANKRQRVVTQLVR